MKNQRLTVKRRPARKKSGLTTLFANVMRKNKRHRAATADPASLEGDVPNLGVARALIVILAIHVVAIAGIFFHSHWLENDEVITTSKPETRAAGTLAITPPADDSGLTKIRSGDAIYTVGFGDTFPRVAARFGIDEMELRAANPDVMEIRHGNIIKIPPKTITAVEPPEVAELRHGARQLRPEPPANAAPSRPAIPPAAGLVTTEAAREVDAAQGGREPAVALETTSASQETYKVKPGDTLWGISQKYHTTVEKLQTLNGIKKPEHLKVGMDLRLP